MRTKLQFWYPVIYSADEPFGKPKIERMYGSIYAINLSNEPYEIYISADGYSYHAIFGSQTNGHFLCVPDWNLGCELASYSDKGWNAESILKTGRVSVEAAYAISNAIDLLAFLLK